MWASIVDGALRLLNSIVALFTKTPEEKKNDEIKDRLERRRDNAAKIGKAMEDGAKGDTSGINDIINRN